LGCLAAAVFIRRRAGIPSQANAIAAIRAPRWFAATPCRRVWRRAFGLLRRRSRSARRRRGGREHL